MARSVRIVRGGGDRGRDLRTSIYLGSWRGPSKLATDSWVALVPPRGSLACADRRVGHWGDSSLADTTLASRRLITSNRPALLVGCFGHHARRGVYHRAPTLFRRQRGPAQRWARRIHLAFRDARRRLPVAGRHGRPLFCLAGASARGSDDLVLSWSLPGPPSVGAARSGRRADMIVRRHGPTIAEVLRTVFASSKYAFKPRQDLGRRW